MPRAHAIAWVLIAFWSNAVAGTAPFSKTGNLNEGRHGHTATLLQDGSVLIVGGWAPFHSLASAEVYDPATETWNRTGSMATARQGHAATLLPSGKVLVVAGATLRDGQGGSDVLSSAEVYDPATKLWTSTGSLHTARSGHIATALPNGKVIVVGGSAKSHILFTIEIYDPVTQRWNETNRPNIASLTPPNAAILLSNGQLLVVTQVGHDPTARFNPPSGAKIYDPTTGKWKATGSLHGSLVGCTAILLPNGKAFMDPGPETVVNRPIKAELYDPASGSWTEVGDLKKGRFYHTTTLLPDNSVLTVGGVYQTRGLDPPNATFIPESQNALRTDPFSGVARTAGQPVVARKQHTATLLNNGKVLLAGGGGAGRGTASGTAELFDPFVSPSTPAAKPASQ